MARQARLDAPGVLHHVIIRGIERKKIFKDKTDQDNFVDRLACLIPETQTACYAWTLMGNHAHFLFRSGPSGLATLMRRLLTGYAVSFNRRHKRHGQLFQNRYKSIICQEDTYFKELLRYIHLNPLRGKIVDDLKGLQRYPYCGHGVLLNRKQSHWQDIGYVLKYFSDRKKEARKKYLSYVTAGLNQGHRPELVGGGLIRSLGGWAEVKSIRKFGMDRLKGDQRILGDSDFVQSVLDIADEKFERTYELKKLGIDLDYITARVLKIFDIEKNDLFIKNRQKPVADARGLFCYWAVRELGFSLSHMAHVLTMTPAGVSYAVRRGASIVKQKNYQLVEESI
jgi:putative transposase